MRMIILGIGDAFTRLHFGASAVVQAPTGRHILIDCPDLIHRALHCMSQRAGIAVSVREIDDIILTHLHGDHCNGLESFGFYRRIMRMRGESVTIPRLHVSQPVAQRLWERLAPAMDASMNFPAHSDQGSRPSRLDDYFDVRILDPGSASSAAGLMVRCRPTRHPVPTIGLKISDGRSTIGWSADTPFEADHVEWLSEADVIVHESNLGSSHTSIESLNQLPVDLRRKMRLIHLADDFDRSCTDIRILEEGEIVEVAPVQRG
jgi:ribonuclease BN (tRNA processing enzyme)